MGCLVRARLQPPEHSTHAWQGAPFKMEQRELRGPTCCEGEEAVAGVCEAG